MTMTPLRILGRVRSFAVAHPIVALVLIASVGLGTAAITITYTSPSTIGTGATPSPVQFAAGDDAAAAPYVSGYTISPDRTFFAATVRGIPEATVSVGSLVKIQNVDNVSHVVTLATPPVSNAKVSAYAIELRDAQGALQGTLDLLATAPGVSFTLPAGETWTASTTLTLLSGATSENVALENSLTMVVV